MTGSFKISYFAVKNEWPFGYSFQNLVFRCKKTNGRLGTRIKDKLYFVFHFL